MRTTLSIPDATFEAAGRLARRLGISFDELIAQALAVFIEAHQQEISVQSNRVDATEDPALDDDAASWHVVSARCGFSDSW